MKLTKGYLAGEELAEWSAQDFVEFCAQSESSNLSHISFYEGSLDRVAFRGVSFQTCNFSKSTFRRVNFRKCTFKRVDLTRTRFLDCFFSDCTFTDCNPYYASFEKSVIHPSAFKSCYRSVGDWNRATVLFTGLKRDLEATGNGRASRAAEYYYRKWERIHLYHKWRFRQLSGMTPWLWSWLLDAFMGYGERPIYLLIWMLGLITVMGGVYKAWFPFSISPTSSDFWSYWYFSFKIFCAKGFTNDVLSKGLLFCQVLEFSLGLVLLSLLVGSVTRKLS